MSDKFYQLSSDLEFKAFVFDSEELQSRVFYSNIGLKLFKISAYPKKNLIAGTKYKIATLTGSYKNKTSLYKKVFLTSTTSGRLEISSDGSVNFTVDQNTGTDSGINVSEVYY